MTSMSLERQEQSGAATHNRYDVVVVGAGPYGLSTAAHLLAHTSQVAVFGKPLELWRDAMPHNMLLRSYWWATSLSDPDHRYSFARYFQEHERASSYPLPKSVFVEYGLWFQRHAVPQVDETFVTKLSRREDSFEALLADGRSVQSRAVVMAPGLGSYVHVPTTYDHLPPELVSHTSHHVAFECFAGKRLAIIGAGQAALETAALAYECGAEVHVVSRRAIRWLREGAVDGRTLWQRLRAPKAGISPGWFNWGLEHFPYVFQQLPRSAKDSLLHGKGSYGPAGAAWLKPRLLGKVVLHEPQHVQSVREADDGAILEFADQTHLHVDHIIVGTGYRVNINRLPMLDPALLKHIQTYQQAPILNQHFESSVPGLYFLGLSSVLSCGPLYRFVIGTDAAARRITEAITQQSMGVSR